MIAWPTQTTTTLAPISTAGVLLLLSRCPFALFLVKHPHERCPCRLLQPLHGVAEATTRRFEANSASTPTKNARFSLDTRGPHDRLTVHPPQRACFGPFFILFMYQQVLKFIVKFRLTAWPITPPADTSPNWVLRGVHFAQGGARMLRSRVPRPPSNGFLWVFASSKRVYVGKKRSPGGLKGGLGGYPCLHRRGFSAGALVQGS
jgi:hypothetical protein